MVKGNRASPFSKTSSLGQLANALAAAPYATRQRGASVHAVRRRCLNYSRAAAPIHFLRWFHSVRAPAATPRSRHSGRPAACAHSIP